MSNLKNPPKPEQHEHPSYGMIALSRTYTSGKTRMFGSSLERHYGTVMLTIKRGKWEHEHHRDRYYSTGEELIRVHLTAAQFVEMITSMNRGDGTPCTLQQVGGKSIPDPPSFATEVDRVRSDFGEKLAGMVSVLKEQRADIENETSKLSTKAKERLRIALDVMIQQVTSNIPFVLSQFEEASERVVTAAKHEIESFAQHRFDTAGLEAIRSASIQLLASNPCPQVDGCILPHGHTGNCQDKDGNAL